MYNIYSFVLPVVGEMPGGVDANVTPTSLFVNDKTKSFTPIIPEPDAVL